MEMISIHMRTWKYHPCLVESASLPIFYLVRPLLFCSRLVLHSLKRSAKLMICSKKVRNGNDLYPDEDLEISFMLLVESASLPIFYLVRPLLFCSRLVLPSLKHSAKLMICSKKVGNGNDLYPDEDLEISSMLGRISFPSHFLFSAAIVVL